MEDIDIDFSVISAAESSNKFPKTRFWKEKSVEDVVTLGLTAQATLVDMKNKHCKVRDYLHLTTAANHYNWPIKNSHFLPVLLEGTVLLACLQAQADFHTSSDF